jgi:hypothetical protein
LILRDSLRHTARPRDEDRKARGLALPQSLLLRADEVIQ